MSKFEINISAIKEDTRAQSEEGEKLEQLYCRLLQKSLYIDRMIFVVRNILGEGAQRKRAQNTKILQLKL